MSENNTSKEVLPELEDSIIEESKVELKLDQTTIFESDNKSLISNDSSNNNNSDNTEETGESDKASILNNSVSSEEISLIMSNLANVFATSQVDNLKKMNYNVLKSKHVHNLTNASIGSQLYTTATEMFSSILRIKDVLANSESDVETVESIKAIVETSFQAFRTILSPSSTIETLARHLSGDIAVLERVDTNQILTPSTSIPIAASVCSLEKGTPIFSGKKDEIITNWLIIINNKFATSKIEDVNKISCILPFLRDSALETTINYIAQKGYTCWSDYEALLIRTFQPIDLQRRLRLQLKNLTHSSKIDDFNRQFMLLSNRIQNLSEEDKLLWYVEALKGRTRYEVNSKNPQSLDEAIIIATNYETLTSEKAYELNSFNKTKKPNSGLNAQKQAVKCYACGKLGHKSNVCRSKEKSTDTNKKGGDNSKTPNKNSITCHKCKKTGHYANECRSALKRVNTLEVNVLRIKEIYAVANSTLEDLLFQSVSIEDGSAKHEAIALLDSGASVCTISDKFAKLTKILYKKSNCMLKSVHGESQVIGITDPVIVTMFDTFECKIQFYVIKSSHEIILGANWMKAMNAGVAFQNGEPVVSFNQTFYSIESGEQIKTASELGFNIMSTTEENESIAISEILDEDDLEFELEWDLSNKNPIVSQTKLNNLQEIKMQSLRTDLKSVIANNLSELGKCNVSTHKITMIDDSPTFVPAYRKSVKEREIIKLEIEELEKAGIISKSRSPNSAPIFLVGKKDGGHRMVLNYKLLNNKMKTEQWPIPRIDDILERLATSRVFTKLDLKSGYYQIPLDEDSKKYTAFNTSDGAYEFNVTPFGLKNAPFECSRIMKTLFGELPFVDVFIDDITIHSKDIDEHFEHISVVIQKIRTANMKLNIAKCVFITSKLEILGHVVEMGKIQMDNKKILAIQKRIEPTNVKQLQSFLGICNYYRRFVKDYAAISKPLVLLLCKEKKWDWNQNCIEAFIKLKECLTSYPILRAPNFNIKFTIHTDASHYAIGAILTQSDENNNEYVVAYASRLLKNAEIHYNTSEKECLAVVWSIKYFRPYIYGTRFDVLTDHSSLRWLLNIRDPTGRLARWNIYLQASDYNIIHRRGILHSNVDALSRPVNNIEIEEVASDDDEDAVQYEPFENMPLMHYLKFGRHISGASRNQINKIRKLILHFKLFGNLLKYKKLQNDPFVIYPKKGERREIIKTAHDNGHFKAISVYNRIREEYYWKGMRDQIISWINKCQKCQRNDRVTALNHPAIAIEVTGIFDQVGIDLVFGLTITIDGFKGIMVITEFLSQFAYAYPIKSKSADEISKNLINYISIFSPPKAILTDFGNEFNNQIISRILENTAVEHLVTSGWNPRCNGKTERLNRTLIDCLRKHAEGNNSTWPDYLPATIIAYNSRVHTTTGFTPFELMFGRKMNKFENWETKKPLEDVLALQNRIDQLHNVINSTQQKALIDIKEHQGIQKQTQDRKKKILHDDIAPGTFVMIKNEGFLSKLEPKFGGPYKVVRRTKYNNYELVDTNNAPLKRAVPVHKLKIIDYDETKFSEAEEVEKIIDQRVNGKHKEYLVIWKSDKTQSWLPESDFNSMECINEFNSKIVKRQKGRPRKATINCMTILFIIFLCITNINCTKLELKTKFCEVTGNNLNWDENTDCSNKDFDSPKIKLITYTLLSKMHDIVSGDGIQCFKTQHTFKFSEDIWGYRTDSTVIENVPVSRQECQVMNERKICGEKAKMTCQNENCWYTPVVVPSYKWYDTVTIVVFSCKVNPKTIIAHDETSKLLGTKCRARDMECTLHDSTIIWSTDIIHTCPFNRIGSVSFNTSGDILINSSLHLLLQIKNAESQCNIKMYTTEEGIYLLPHIQTNEHIWKRLDQMFPKIDQTSLVDLQLADTDFGTYNNIKREQAIKENLCRLFMTNLNLFKLSEDRFLTIYDSLSNPIIIYSNKNRITIPTCVDVNEIELIEKTEFCYEDFPVKFVIDNKTFSGFLTIDKIIKKNSKHIQCSEERKTLYLAKADSILILNNNKITIKTANLRKSKLSIKQKNLNLLNFHHSKMVVDGIDTISEFLKLSPIKEGDEHLVVLASSVNKNKEYTEDSDHQRANYLNNIYKSVGIISIGLSIIIITIIIIIFFKSITKFISKCGNCSKCKNTKSSKTSDDKVENLELVEVVKPKTLILSKRESKLFVTSTPIDQEAQSIINRINKKE